MWKKLQRPFGLIISRTKCIVLPYQGTQNFSCQTQTISRCLPSKGNKLHTSSGTFNTKLSTYRPLLQKSTDDLQQNGNIDYVMKRIKDKFNSIGKTIENDRYCEIRDKLHVLQKHGCIISHIPEFMSVLNLSENEIERRANRLESAYMLMKTPELFIENNETDYQLKIMAYKQLKKITGIEKIEYLLCMKLECQSAEEWKCLKPYVCKTPVSVPSFFNRVDLFIAHGITLEEIKKHPHLLKLPNAFIPSRIKILNEFYPYVNRSTFLKMLEFYKMVDAEKYKDFFTNCFTAEEAANQLQQYLSDTKTNNDKLDKEYKRKKMLVRKSSFLIREGISKKCIVENIYCLRPKVYILERIIKEVKVQNKMVDSNVVMTKIFEHMINNEKEKKAADLSLPIEIFLRNKLKISDNEIKELHPYLGGKTAQNTMISKINFLLEEGYTVQDIVKHPTVLKKSLNNLRQRLQKLRQGDEACHPLIEILCYGWAEMSRLNSTVQNYRESLGKAKTKFDALSDMLDVPSKSQDIFIPIQHMRLDYLKKKIDFLLSIGISKVDIVNDIFCLKLSLVQLKQNVEILTSKGESNITLMKIIGLTDREIKKRSASKHFLKSKLSLTDEEKSKLKPDCLYNTAQVLQSNIRLLLENGFTLEALKTCPYIIAHSSHILEEYLKQLPRMEDLCEDIKSDKVKLINFLQYKIEKNNDFRRVVNDDEEILGMDQARLSFLFSKVEKQ